MPVKRRKLDESTPTASTQKPTARADKPLSAIAAARLRAEAATKSAAVQETTLEPLAAPSSPPAEDLVSEYEESEASPEPVIRKRDIKLCNWQSHPRDIFAESESELSINLDKNTTIALVGHFDFRVSRGAININGANIGAVTKDGQKAKTYRAYVPATHPIFKIRGLDSKNHVQFTSCKEPAPLAKLSPLFEDIWNTGSRGERRRTFGIITRSDEDPLQRPLQPQASPEDWLRAIEDCASEPSSTLVTGPPESGKSTFCRRLINRYLTGMGKAKPAVPAVCFLDLDPTNPEYSPAGQISLVVVKELNLGPTFTHPTTLPNPGPEQNETIRAHAIPLNLANYQDHYRDCIDDLYLAYKNLYARDSALPLLVNTPPMLYTTHFAILEQLLSRCKPRHIVHMGGTRAVDVPQAETSSSSSNQLAALKRVAQKQRSVVHDITTQSLPRVVLRSNSQLRTMTTQSYFHFSSSSSSSSSSQSQSQSQSQPPTWSPSPLTTHPPLSISYQSTQSRTQDIIGILSYSEPLPPSALLHYLNGAVVHILVSPSSSSSSSSTSSTATSSTTTTLPRTPKFHIPFFPPCPHSGTTPAPNPRTTRFLCAGLVRGIDPRGGELHVLVPRGWEGVVCAVGSGSAAAVEMMVVAVGCAEVPGWAYMEGGNAGVWEEERGERKVGGGVAEGEGEGEPVWVLGREVWDGMGYLGTERRVRRFIVGEKEGGR